MRSITALLAAATFAMALAGQAPAQGLFAPAITVDGQVITGYELEQRARFLTLLNAPGNVQETARTQLTEERLKLAAARLQGFEATEELIQEGMAEFAARAQLTTEEFIKAIEARGVDENTFRDFIIAGQAWREVVRVRFGGRVNASEDEVDRFLASSNNGANVRVLLSEIIMPAPPQQIEAVRARADRISQITTIGAFAAEARRYSAAPTRGAGGRLPWRNLTELPPALRPIILGLAPGEVSDPLPIPNAIALFQLRAIEETDYQTPDYAAIEYATYAIPGGRTDAAIAEAQKIAGQSDRCDDLYGIAKGEDPGRLIRESKKPDEIETDIAIELSKLDPGEVSYTLTRANGQALLLVMLCGRTPQIAEDASREDIALGLRNRRLEQLADSYLAQLKADARIIEK